MLYMLTPITTSTDALALAIHHAYPHLALDETNKCAVLHDATALEALGMHVHVDTTTDEATLVHWTLEDPPYARMPFLEALAASFTNGVAQTIYFLSNGHSYLSFRGTFDGQGGYSDTLIYRYEADACRSVTIRGLVLDDNDGKASLTLKARLEALAQHFAKHRIPFTYQEEAPIRIGSRPIIGHAAFYLTNLCDNDDQHTLHIREAGVLFQDLEWVTDVLTYLVGDLIEHDVTLYSLSNSFDPITIKPTSTAFSTEPFESLVTTYHNRTKDQ